MIEFRKFAQHHTFGMDKGACYSEAMEFDLLPSHHRAMQSSGVQETMHRYGDILLDYLPKRVAEAENEGEEVDLVDFAFDVMVCHHVSLPLRGRSWLSSLSTILLRKLGSPPHFLLPR